MVHGNCIIFGANIICFLVMGKYVMLNEYSCQIPANRIGFEGNGGPFSLMQLKVIQEVITLIIFTVLQPFSLKERLCTGIIWQHSFA